MHINEAVLHEYLDRGADAGSMSDVDTHLNECAACRLLLDSVIKERSAASAILRAAAPTGMARPSFESLLPRPKFDTLEGAHATDVAFDHQVQYKQMTLGMRGQAIAWLWAASVVFALGAGYFAKVVQDDAVHSERVAQTADSISKLRASAPADSSAPVTSTAVDSMQRLAEKPPVKKPGVATRVATATAPTSNTEQSNAGAASTSTAMSEPAAAPIAQSAMSRNTDGRMAENLTRSVIGGKAAADKPIRPTEFVDVNLNAYPDTLTVTVIGLPHEEWRVISADSALSLLGGQMIRARDLRVLDYAVSSTSSITRVRVRQRIAGNTARNDTLEIYQTPPRTLDRTAAPEQLTSRAGRTAIQNGNGAFRNVAGGSYFRRFYTTMIAPDARVVTVIAGKPGSVSGWKPELTSLTHD